MNFTGFTIKNSSDLRAAKEMLKDIRLQLKRENHPDKSDLHVKEAYLEGAIHRFIHRSIKQFD